MLTALRRRWPLIVLALVAMGVRLYGLGWGLPELFEEAYPLKVAWKLWAFGPHAAFSGNPHFFKYPSFTIYLQFVGQALLYVGLALTGRIHSTLDFRVLYQLDPTPFAMAGRLITAAFGAATAPVTFLLVERLLAGRRSRESAPGAPGAALATGAAWTAALLVALNPWLLARSQEIEVDLPMAFFVGLAAYLALRLGERASVRACALAGAAAGLAASCKYPGAIALVPCVLALLLADAGALRAAAPAKRSPAPRSPASRARTERRRAGPAPAARTSRPGAASARVRAIAIVLVAAGVAFLVTSPYVLLDRASFLKDLGAEREHMRFGHFGTADGPAWGYYALAWTRVLGWPLGVASAAAVALALVRRQRGALELAAAIALYYAVVGSWSMKADRYLAPLVPIALALGAAALAEVLGRWPALRARTAALAAWGAVGIVGIATTLALWAPITARLEPDSRTLARRWVEANVPEGALVAFEPYGPTLVGPSDLLAMDADVAARLRTATPRPRLYATLAIPMFQVAPARSAPFYDAALYRPVDVFVVTGSVRDRYRGDPAAFAAQLAFYAALEGTTTRLASFRAAGSGPQIAIYGVRRAGPCFAARDSVPLPGEYHGNDTGGENYFFWNLGIDYEATGRLEQAIECYRRGLRYPPADMARYRALAERLGHCLLATRRPDDALAYLQAAAAGAGRGELAAFAWLRIQIASGRPGFAGMVVPRIGGPG
jgi:tetratricopeptide (TPR) repeat protein